MSQDGSDLESSLQEQLRNSTPPASPPSTPSSGSPDPPDNPQSPVESDDDEDGQLDTDVNGQPEHTDERFTEQQSTLEHEENEFNNLHITEEQNGADNQHEERDKNKRRSDEMIGLRDELDFEAERESGEEEGEAASDDEGNEGIIESEDDIPKEEGELSEEEEEDSSLRQEPKTVCRFFNKGQCTWGTNCRFLHPGVSDKGNYNMFAPSRPQTLGEREEQEKAQRERPREVRRYAPEPSPFETAWERGLRYAKEMMKRASKRKETDADFEEKRFNLSLGQAELDRENDYYTRPASPVYKPPVTEEAIEYLDPYERQAVRHFRGGHFENFEVRYNVDPHYNVGGRGGGNSVPPGHPPHGRSRREKYDREVGERGNEVHRGRQRGGHRGGGGDQRWVWREAAGGAQHENNKRYHQRKNWGGEERYKESGGGRGEAEAWADPWARRKSSPQRKKTSRTRSYSSGSSSRSSSRSSRSTSYSSYSRSRSRSKSSKSSHSSKSSSRSRSPPIRRSGPGERFGRHNTVLIKGRPVPIPITSGSARRGGMDDPREPRDPRLTIPRRPMELKVPKQEPRDKRPGPPERDDHHTRPHLKQPPPKEKVDAFGRIPKKIAERNYSTSPVRSPVRRHARGRSYSLSRSRSSSRSSVTNSRPGSRSSYSRSSSSSSNESDDDRAERRRLANANLSYGQSNKGKPVDPAKTSGLKQQIKLTLKGTANKINKSTAALIMDEDSGESDDNTTALSRKRKANSSPQSPPPSKIPASPPQSNPLPPIAAAAASAQKKSTLSRRDELLKQLRAVEDAIKRKRSKLPT